MNTTSVESEELKKGLIALVKQCKVDLQEEIAANSNSFQDVLESRSSESKLLIDSLNVSIGKLESNLIQRTTEIDGISGTQRLHGGSIAELKEECGKVARIIDVLQQRLDGTSIGYVEQETYPIEKMRVVVKSTADRLNGAGGLLPYDKIQSAIANTQFLGKAFSWLLGTFGVGAVITAVVTLTGVGGSKVDSNVTGLKEKIQELERKVEKVENRQFDLKK